MRGNKVLYLGIAILVLGISFAIGTYAYYQSTITGTASGTVLAWNCSATGDSANLSFNLGSLHPGSSGSKTISISATIAATYEVRFTALNNMGTGSSRPNLKLYKDSGKTTEILASASNIVYDGNIPANGTATATFYYDWPYGTSAEAYSSAAPSATISVVCKQE